MNLLRTKWHGVFDYFIGAFLVMSPWLFDFANSGSAQNVPIILGGSMLVYSVFTNYETGVVKMLSVRFHLALDFIVGLTLVLSPLVFKFSGEVVFPHVFTGMVITTISLITATPLRNTREWMMWNFKRQYSK